jgi:hypothetical protein
VGSAGAKSFRPALSRPDFDDAGKDDTIRDEDDAFLTHIFMLEIFGIKKQLFN